MATQTLRGPGLTGNPPRCWRCGAQHRSWRLLARCRWRSALWIEGEGRYASLSRCHPGGTVRLYARRGDAHAAKDFIDRLACGGRCRGDHDVIDLAAGD